VPRGTGRVLDRERRAGEAHAPCWLGAGGPHCSCCPCADLAAPDSVTPMGLSFTIEVEQEDDGRWIAEVLDLPGVLAYAATERAAIAAAEALALRVLAERHER